MKVVRKIVAKKIEQEVNNRRILRFEPINEWMEKRRKKLDKIVREWMLRDQLKSQETIYPQEEEGEELMVAVEIFLSKKERKRKEEKKEKETKKKKKEERKYPTL